MSEQFVNAYIEGSTSVLHDFLSTILQLKAQLKVLESQSKEKEELAKVAVESKASAIELTEKNKELLEQIDTINASLVNVQRECEAYKTKASHIDTVINQMNSFKTMISERDQKISTLEAKNQECVEQILKLEKDADQREKYVTSLEQQQEKLQKQIDKLTPQPKSATTKKKTPKVEPVESQVLPDEQVQVSKEDDF
jgi:chromosome segregation ATPase